MALSSLGNIAEFIGGFAGQREKIAAANQEDKNYKLSTVQTLFQFAEGKRASAEASRLLAGDTNLSANEQERHRLAAESHTAEGERLYAGASELFGLIDEKPKTGKKENPAMQFLQFVNPFKRRGPQAGGEFETELSALLSSLGGGKGATGGAGAESPGFTAGGIGGATPTGQGAGAPEQTAVSAALGAAIPGVGPTPRPQLAAGDVSPAAAMLAGQQRPVVGTATGEAVEAGVAPVTAITPTPARGPLLEERVISARELYPHITGTRSAYRDMNLSDYNERINQEGQSALSNLNAYLQSTPVRETFADAMNDPDFTKHYRPAARAFQDLKEFDIFQSNIAAIFPEMRENPPEAGAAMAADVARQLRLEQQGGKFGDASTWTPATVAAVEAFDVWASMQPTLSPEFGVLRRYIAITRKDQSTRTPAEQREVDVFIDLYDRGIYGVGPGAGGGAGGVNYQFPTGIGPDGREIYFVVNPRDPIGTPPVPLRDAFGRVITTEGPIKLDEIMFTAEYTMNPETGSMERRSWKVEEKKVIAALSRPGTRRQIQAWIGSGFIFDTYTADRIQKYLDDNPTAGLAPGEDITRSPGNPGNLGGLEAFRRRALEREGGGGATAPAYVPPPSPYE